MVASAIPLSKLAFILTDVHTSIALLVALSVADSHIGDCASSSVQSWTTDDFVFRFESRWWRSRPWKHGTLVRELGWLCESNAKDVARFQIFCKKVIMADAPDLNGSSWAFNFEIVVNVVCIVAQRNSDRPIESLHSRSGRPNDSSLDAFVLHNIIVNLANFLHQAV